MKSFNKKSNQSEMKIYTTGKKTGKAVLFLDIKFIFLIEKCNISPYSY